VRSRDCCDNCTAHLLRGGQEGGSTDAATGRISHRMKGIFALGFAAGLGHGVSKLSMIDPVSR